MLELLRVKNIIDEMQGGSLSFREPSLLFKMTFLCRLLSHKSFQVFFEKMRQTISLEPMKVSAMLCRAEFFNVIFFLRVNKTIA